MNGARTNWMEVFLSAHGRMGRAAFLVTGGALVLAGSLYEAMVVPSLQWVTGVVVYPVLFFCGGCVLSKRLHDRGRSGWWAVLVLAALIAIWPQPQGFWDFLASVVLVWAVVELGAMPSEPGTNRFGPGPSSPIEG